MKLIFMGSLSGVGRIFFGISIAALGLLTIYNHDVPYFLLPAKHAWFSDHAVLGYLSGALLLLAGGCITFQKFALQSSLLLGIVLLLIFCFYFIPYQFISSPRYMHFGDWENAFKELALAAGAFVIASGYSGEHLSPFLKLIRKLVFLGAPLYALSIISFSIDHFLYAKEAQGYIPDWIPAKLFWMYFAGIALLGAGIGILLKIRPQLMAMLLGIMIFSWVIMLHLPKSIADPGGEMSSGFLALAYSGTAFSIARGGLSKK